MKLSEQRKRKYSISTILFGFSLSIFVIRYIYGGVLGVVLSSIFMGIGPVIFPFFYSNWSKYHYVLGEKKQLTRFLAFIPLIFVGGLLLIGILETSEENILNGLTYIFNASGLMAIAIELINIFWDEKNRDELIAQGEKILTKIMDVKKERHHYSAGGQSRAQTTYTTNLQEINGNRQFVYGFKKDPRPIMENEGITHITVYLDPYNSNKYYVENRDIE